MDDDDDVVDDDDDVDKLLSEAGEMKLKCNNSTKKYLKEPWGVEIGRCFLIFGNFFKVNLNTDSIIFSI